MSTAPWISDHALLRYIERALDIPVETIRANLTARLKHPINVAQAIGGEYRVKINGVEFICRDNAVVTVTVKGK